MPPPGHRREFAVAGAAALAIAIATLALDRFFPPPLPEPGHDAPTVVVARDGTPLRAFPTDAGTWRYPVSVDEVSPRYLEALIGYEDRRFHAHPGVDPLALARAIAQAMRHGRVVSGGSTLTMQVARLIEPIPRTPLGKLKQAVRALQIERRLDKRGILQVYLDRAPFGGNLEGVAAASHAYLGKAPDRLSHSEAALLAVLPQAPSRLRPDRHPEAARAARDKVLARLAEFRVWPEAALAEAAEEPVVARSLRPPLSAALLAERLRRADPDAALIRTTIDARVQHLVERRVAAHLAALPERTGAAVLVLDAASLEALAYVGSGRYADPARLGHVDMVIARRSPGSTLKPFLYGLALDDGLIHSASLLVDAPQDFDGYRPANFGDVFRGPVSAADALKLSLNVPAVDLLERIGPARFSARLHHGGVDLALPRGASPNLAIALGGVATTLEDLVGGYATFARGGLAGAPRYRGDAPLDERRVMGEGAAWIVRDMLGTDGRPGDGIAGLDVSRRARLAWKTGTSYGFRDAWAIGVTPSLVVGVWIGRPDGTPMPGQYGAITALPLLVALADALPRGTGDSAWPAPPAGVVRVPVCWPLGIAADAHEEPALCHRRLEAWTLAGSTPPTLPDRHEPPGATLRVSHLVDVASGRRVRLDCAPGTTRTAIVATWPTRLAPWLPASITARARPPDWAPGCLADAAGPTRGRLRIDGRLDGLVLRPAPGSNRAPTVDLAAIGADGEVDWLVNDRLVGRSRPGRPLRHRFEQAGEQVIVAMDGSGQHDRARLEVLDIAAR
jgi:penicillin-binding protein 1C